jgi:hypothetical protein
LWPMRHNRSAGCGGWREGRAARSRGARRRVVHGRGGPAGVATGGPTLGRGAVFRAGGSAASLDCESNL